MTIHWSERAIERLTAIHDYMHIDSPSRAQSLVRELFERVEQIRIFPRSGRIVPEYTRAEIREITHTSYRILYRISDDRIEIVNIMHYRERL